jgi:hypothetical protein
VTFPQSAAMRCRHACAPRGRRACNAVAYELSDEFVAALNCHCSNCRGATGSAFLPWGEIERAKLRVTNSPGSLMVIGDAGANHAMRCGECGSLLVGLSRRHVCPRCVWIGCDNAGAWTTSAPRPVFGDPNTGPGDCLGSERLGAQ